MFISGVVTQGASRGGFSEFVETYKISYSLDGQVFEFYKDENQNHEKVGKREWLKAKEGKENKGIISNHA